MKGNFINDGASRKELTILKKTELNWLKEVSNNVTKQNLYQKIQIGKEGENRYKFTKTNNIKKLEREIKLIQRRLSNIRLNYIHQTTTAIAVLIGIKMRQ